jgi:hypothetical protein
LLDACDELGILVWEEVPNIKIHVYPPPQDGNEPVYTTRFPRPLMDNIKQQLREMIERDRNHPSIVIWGLADDLSRYQYPEDFIELSDATYALDPTRWTAGRAPHVTDIIDAITFEDLWGEHEKHPELRYVSNEWGAIPSERGREGPALLHGEELRAVADSEAALFQEGYLMQWNAMSWLGTLKWCMFDCGKVQRERPSHAMGIRRRQSYSALALQRLSRGLRHVAPAEEHLLPAAVAMDGSADGPSCRSLDLA